jgi:hypothetical protein
MGFTHLRNYFESSLKKVKALPTAVLEVIITMVWLRMPLRMYSGRQGP